jgi:hypothetical protein
VWAEPPALAVAVLMSVTVAGPELSAADHLAMLPGIIACARLLLRPLIPGAGIPDGRR